MNICKICKHLDSHLIARDGHLECLKYFFIKKIKAYTNSLSWHPHTTYLAAMYGHLDCLKYAHENGCSWDPDTIASAANGGHLDCIIYAHKNGCPWHMDASERVANVCNIRHIFNLHRDGCPFLLKREIMYPVHSRLVDFMRRYPGVCPINCSAYVISGVYAVPGPDEHHVNCAKYIYNEYRSYLSSKDLEYIFPLVNSWVSLVDKSLSHINIPADIKRIIHTLW
jgi:hypothetical protein